MIRLRQACVLAVVLNVLCAAGLALAAVEDKVEVQIWAIRATKSNSDISPELKPIADKLRAQFKFTGYKLEKRDLKKAELKDDVKSDLGKGFKAVVTPLKRDGDRVQLRIAVTRSAGGKDEPQVRTSITTERGQFQLLGGWKYDGDDVLIMAVAAR